MTAPARLAVRAVVRVLSSLRIMKKEIGKEKAHNCKFSNNIASLTVCITQYNALSLARNVEVYATSPTR